MLYSFPQHGQVPFQVLPFFHKIKIKMVLFKFRNALTDPLICFPERFIETQTTHFQFPKRRQFSRRKIINLSSFSSCVLRLLPSGIWGPYVPSTCQYILSLKEQAHLPWGLTRGLARYWLAHNFKVTSSTWPPPATRASAAASTLPSFLKVQCVWELQQSPI